MCGAILKEGQYESSDVLVFNQTYTLKLKISSRSCMISFLSHGPHSSEVKRSQAALMTLATCAEGIMVKREIESERIF